MRREGLCRARFATGKLSPVSTASLTKKSVAVKMTASPGAMLRRTGDPMHFYCNPNTRKKRLVFMLFKSEYWPLAGMMKLPKLTQTELVPAS